MVAPSVLPLVSVKILVPLNDGVEFNEATEAEAGDLHEDVFDTTNGSKPFHEGKYDSWVINCVSFNAEVHFSNEWVIFTYCIFIWVKSGHIIKLAIAHSNIRQPVIFFFKRVLLKPIPLISKYFVLKPYGLKPNFILSNWLRIKSGKVNFVIEYSHMGWFFF